MTDLQSMLKAIMGPQDVLGNPGLPMTSRLGAFAQPDIGTAQRFAQPAMSAYTQPKPFQDKLPGLPDYSLIEKSQELRRKMIEQQYELYKLMLQRLGKQ